MVNDINKKIRDFNKGRYPETLKLKYELMRADKFRFLRATTHLFYEDIPAGSFLFNSPYAWICGDLHLENLGSYKADNRIAYFNVNDFDECLLAPCLLDTYRLIISVIVSSSNLDLSNNDARSLSSLYIDTYFKTLSEGYIRTLEKQTARGVIKRFLKNVSQRKRKDFLKNHVTGKNDKYNLIVRPPHTLPLSDSKKEEVERHIKKWAKLKNDSDFYKVYDVAFRIAGTSSLGMERYVILVEGRGILNGAFLLDLKETAPSCAAKHVPAKQPNWKDDAERLVEVQKRILSAPPALLADIHLGKKSFILKELQPTADRIDYTIFKGNVKKLKNMLEDMASVSAWDNLRTGGRQGSAIADEFIYFAKNSESLKKNLLEAAFAYAGTLDSYYKSYCKAYDSGYFKLA
ncbi:MAG TPA: DUF2252 family protein [Bacteroidia bacterium]|nr:DUF2252 family protein [Bacteroidia bacterium]